MSACYSVVEAAGKYMTAATFHRYYCLTKKKHKKQHRKHLLFRHNLRLFFWHQKLFDDSKSTSGLFLFSSYYMNGRISKAKDLINPEKFDAYERLIHSTQKIVRSTSHAHLPVWNGETADAYGHGIVNMTDRFISGFL